MINGEEHGGGEKESRNVRWQNKKCSYKVSLMGEKSSIVLTEDCCTVTIKGKWSQARKCGKLLCSLPTWKGNRKWEWQENNSVRNQDSAGLRERKGGGGEVGMLLVISLLWKTSEKGKELTLLFTVDTRRAVLMIWDWCIKSNKSESEPSTLIWVREPFIAIKGWFVSSWDGDVIKRRKNKLTLPLWFATLKYIYKERGKDRMSVAVNKNQDMQ